MSIPGEKIKEKVLKRMAAIPDKQGYRKQYRIAMTKGNAPRSAAIRSFCLECVHWDREEVRLCTAPQCPLYPYRPYKNENEVWPITETFFEENKVELKRLEKGKPGPLYP